MRTNRESKSYLCHNLCQFLISAVHSARHLASLPVLPRCTHNTLITTWDRHREHRVVSSAARTDSTEWCYPIQKKKTEWCNPIQEQRSVCGVTPYKNRQHKVMLQYKNRQHKVVLPNTRTDNTVCCYSVKTESSVVLPNTRAKHTEWWYTV